MRWLLLLFIVVPLVELYLLTWLATVIDFWPTVGMVLFMGALGAAIARREAARVWREYGHAMQTLSPPQTSLIEGLLVLFGCALLVTPGVLTDLAGLLLLVPWTRRLVATRLETRLAGAFVASQRSVAASPFPRGTPPGARGPRVVIDTTGETVER